MRVAATARGRRGQCLVVESVTAQLAAAVGALGEPDQRRVDAVEQRTGLVDHGWAYVHAPSVLSAAQMVEPPARSRTYLGEMAMTSAR